MKTLILFFILGSIAFSQSTNVRRLGKPEQLSDEKQIERLIETVDQLYGSSFKYFNELSNGNYTFTQKDGKYNINILRSGTSKNNADVIEKILINKIREENGNYSFSFDKTQFNKLIDRKKFGSFHVHQSPDNIDTIVSYDHILKDMCILTDPYTFECYHKVFNRSLAMAHVVDTNGNQSPLFRDISDGMILPYEGGEKIVALDEMWSSLIHFDRNMSSNIWHYGEYGFNNQKFNLPSAMTCGREVVDGSTTTYPIFVADQGNSRIISVNYVARDPKLGSGFDPDSWTVINNSVIYPYDIGIFKADDPTNDKIWVSEAPQINPSLLCLNMDGSLVQKVIGYIDSNTLAIYPFAAGSQIKLSVHHNYFGAIAFIDNITNRLVLCPLHEDGTAVLVPYNGSYLIMSHDVEYFPNDVKINSLAFQKIGLSTVGWPYLWVTSGVTPPFYDESQSMIHCFKVDAYPAMQYIASTTRPYNTDWDFVHLNNLVVNQGYYDIFTIEQWSDGYGIRQFRPYVGIRDWTLHDYCEDSLDYMKWQSTLTNECYIDLTAFRKNSNNDWESVLIKKVTHQTFNSYLATIFRWAGNTESDDGRWINIYLDLPMQDYIFGNTIKLHAKLYPEWTSGESIELDDSTHVHKTCLPKAGGCPFLYVKDVNGNFQADNNILHRSEFTTPGTDITDKYKLRITPQVNTNNEIELWLVENENDSSYINQIRFYAIDHPYNTKMGVTENNDIVLYDSASVVASDSAVLNSTNITSHVNFFHPDSIPTNGYKNDNLYAHFSYASGSMLKNLKNNYFKNGIPLDKKKADKNPELKAKSVTEMKNGPGPGPGNSPLIYAFISDLRNLTYPIASAKDTGGVLTATSIYSNVVSKIFARRELNSVVILPLFKDSNKVSNINISWQSDFQMKYLGIATLQYNGFTTTELPLSAAYYVTSTLDSDITTSVANVDANYGLVNSSGLINAKFNAFSLPPLGAKYVREYVVEVNGHYFAGSGSMFSNMHKMQGQTPYTFKLGQNFPNPFNPTTKINYEIPNDSKVKLIIYDILGREVKKIVNDELKKAGRYVVDFDGTNLASGVYFYRIEAGNFVESKKMVLIK